jgi:hypothetical protein
MFVLDKPQSTPRGCPCRARDDESIAHPLYERARQLGINALQFHKGSPFDQQPLEQLSPLDL